MYICCVNDGNFMGIYNWFLQHNKSKVIKCKSDVYLPLKTQSLINYCNNSINLPS